jgi:predicted YcjX-like family ATPase
LPSFSDLLSEAGIAARNLVDLFSGRTLRLGVTGLAGAGKTIFVTAIVQHLTLAARLAALGEKNLLPVFRVHAEGRLMGGRLEPQPDDAVPRFAYERHLDVLTGPQGRSEDRAWPQSTKRISELRLALEFERIAGFGRRSAALSIDIVDYPGEWLLDLTLLDKSYRRWSEESLAAAEARVPLGTEWRNYVQSLDANAPADEDVARRAATLFKSYLQACRATPLAASALPPGRFLMPGDLEGSPLLTFSPLKLETDALPNSLAATMMRRYDAYRTHVVRPFFRDHFARLDRQIVLVDVLAALNAGPLALRDLERALGDVLNAFRTGKNSILSSLLRPKIDKILFAATKADHLNHASHDRLEAIVRRLTARAIARAENLGALIDVVALAAVRATREANVGRGSSVLPAVVGTPIQGERIGDEIFDGDTEVAIFPGQLPDDPDAVFTGSWAIDPGDAEYRFVRFRPPIAARDAAGMPLPLPHIRLDRTLQFLLGDRLR